MSEHAQFLAERLAHRCIHVVVQRTESSPKSVDTDVLVEESRVVESNAFKTLEVGRELVKLGKTATTLLLNANLDVTNPTALELDTLRDDLFLETKAGSTNVRRRKLLMNYRSLMISL